jgi:hypothetical protein
MTDWCKILKRCLCGLCLMTSATVMVDAFKAPTAGQKKPVAAKEDELHPDARGFREGRTAAGDHPGDVDGRDQGLHSTAVRPSQREPRVLGVRAHA